MGVRDISLPPTINDYKPAPYEAAMIYRMAGFAEAKLRHPVYGTYEEYMLTKYNQAS